MIAVCGGLAIVLVSLFMYLNVAGGDRGVKTGVIAALSILVIAPLLHLNSVYYRVGPQKLDVLACAFPCFRLRLLESINLESARIVCRYPKQLLEITTAVREQPTCHAINLGSVDEPHKFVESLFRGAMSARNPIPLPDDELLG